MVVYSLRGAIGSGKSTFGLTLPGKKFILDLEYGAHRATWRFAPESYTIIKLPPNLDLLTYTRGGRVYGQLERWTEIAKEFVKAVQDPQYTTIVFDTLKVAWTADHMAYLQERQEAQIATTVAKMPKLSEEQAASRTDLREQLMPIEYGTPNLRISQMFDITRSLGKDLVLINHERHKYVSTIIDGRITQVPSPDGAMETDGWSDTDKLSDWVFITKRIGGVAVNGSKPFPVSYVMRIDKSPIGSDLVGVSLPVDYAILKALVESKGRKLP